VRKTLPRESVIIHSHQHVIEVWQTLFNVHRHVVKLRSVDVVGQALYRVGVVLFWAWHICGVRYLGMEVEKRFATSERSKRACKSNLIANTSLVILGNLRKAHDCALHTLGVEWGMTLEMAQSGCVMVVVRRSHDPRNYIDYKRDAMWGE